MDKRILKGDFTVFPELLSDYLKRFEYEMVLGQNDTLTFSVVRPGEYPTTLLTLEKVPQETAEKFATLMGLVFKYPPEPDNYTPHWKSPIPVVQLWHNGTEDADRILLELVKLDLPYFVWKDCGLLHVHVQFGNNDSNGLSEAVALIIEAIRAFATKHGKLKAEQIA